MIMRANFILSIVLAASGSVFAQTPVEHKDPRSQQLIQASDALVAIVTEAAALCRSVGAEHLEGCATIGGRSPELSAARKSMIGVYETRSRFMNACEREQKPMQCADLADLQMAVGLYEAMK